MFETNASELASFGRSGGLAIGAAVGLLAAFAAGLHLEGRFKRWLIPVVVVAITLAPALGVIVGGRDLRKLDMLSELAGGGLEAWIYRLATGGVVFLATVRLLARVLRPTHEALPGVALYAAFMGFWLTNLVLPGLFGTVPMLSVSMAYPALVASALFASRHYDVDDLMLAAKWALFVFMALSFVAFFVAPNMSTQFGKVEARLPGIEFRLWGLSSGPNAYGPLGLLMLLLVVHKPFRLLAVTIAAVVVGVFALVLAQSQTTWGAAAIVLPAFIAYRIRYRRGARRRRREHDAGGLKAGRLLFAIGLAVLAVAAFAVLSAQFGVGKGMVSDFGNAMEASRKGREISDLSGRTQIWFIAFEVFKQNPLFGYGPTLWSNEFRMAWRVPFAFHAHNQFMQSLGVGGLVGLLGLLIYVSTLGAMALKVARASRGLAPAIFVVTLVRCMTEVPLDLSTMLVADFLYQMLLFGAVLGYAAVAERRALAGSTRRSSRSRSRSSSRSADASHPDTRPAYDDAVDDWDARDAEADDFDLEEDDLDPHERPARDPRGGRRGTRPQPEPYAGRRGRFSGGGARA